jgi:hypothetical protein
MNRTPIHAAGYEFLPSLEAKPILRAARFRRRHGAQISQLPVPKVMSVLFAGILFHFQMELSGTHTRARKTKGFRQRMEFQSPVPIRYALFGFP